MLLCFSNHRWGSKATSKTSHRCCQRIPYDEIPTKADRPLNSSFHTRDVQVEQINPTKQRTFLLAG